MIFRMFDATARNRRPILLCGVALAIAEAIVIARDPRSLAGVAALAAAVVLVLLAVGSFRQARPTAFMVRPDLSAFVSPPHAGPVYAALCFMVLAAYRVGRVAAALHTDDVTPFDIVLVATHALLIWVVFAEAWTGFDISLRPEGFYDRRAVGTVVVPWQATPTAYVARRRDGSPTVAIPLGAVSHRESRAAGSRPTEVRLAYERPELVRTGGLTRNATRISSEHIDAAFLAAAITFYANHPEERAGIGTDRGHRRLQQALTLPSS